MEKWKRGKEMKKKTKGKYRGKGNGEEKRKQKWLDVSFNFIKWQKLKESSKQMFRLKTIKTMSQADRLTSIIYN